MAQEIIPKCFILVREWIYSTGFGRSALNSMAHRMKFLSSLGG
jgi:hypothetical protein